MAKLMWIAGIVLVAVGVAIGLMIFFSPASIISWGITPEAAAIIIVGGIVSVGIGGVINAIETARPGEQMERRLAPDVPESPTAVIPEFGRRATEAAVVATAPAIVETVSSEVTETINALEQAKQDIRKAFDPKAETVAVTVSETAVTAPAAEAEEDEEEAEAETAAETEGEEEPAETAAEEEPTEEGQLYVVEERTIRNRPARILSDGTVEAETEEGWMRFENLEHLDEYMEAMSPAGRA